MNNSYIVTVGGTRNVDNVRLIATAVSEILSDIFKDRATINHTYADENIGGNCHVHIQSDLPERQIQKIFSSAFSGHPVKTQIFTPDQNFSRQGSIN